MSKVKEDKSRVTLEVDGKQAINQLGKLEMEAKQLAIDLKLAKKGTQEYVDTNKKLKETEAQIKSMRQQLGLTGMTMTQLSRYQRELRKELQNTATYGTKEYEVLRKKLREVSAELNRQRAELNPKGGGGFFGGLASSMKGLGGFAALAIGISSVTEGIVRLLPKLVTLSDKLADVQKTTGLTGEEVRKLNDDLKGLNTRTSQEELLGLAREAGKLGITGRNNILEFVESADKINVALGEDLGADAITTLGKLNDLFGVREIYGYGEAMERTGSAINELGAASTASEGYIVDFTSRLGGAATAAKIAISDVLGLAATLDSFGQEAETSATAVGMFLVDMFKDTKTYAEIAKMEVGEFTNLMNTDANEALLKVLEGINGNNEGFTTMVTKLQAAGVEGSRGIQVLSTLAQNTETLRKQQDLANEAFQKGISIQNEFNTKNETLAANLDKIGNWFLGVFLQTGIMDGLNKFVKGFADLVTITDKATAEFNKQRTATENLQKSVVPLLEKYESLKSKTNLTNQEQIQLREVTQQLAELVPTAVTEFDKYGNAMDINAGKVRNFTEAQRQANLILNADAIKEQRDEIKKLEKDIQQVNWALSRRDEDGDLFKYVNSASGLSQQKVKMTTEEITKLQAKLKELLGERQGRTQIMDDLIGLSPEQIAGRAAFAASGKPAIGTTTGGTQPTNEDATKFATGVEQIFQRVQEKAIETKDFTINDTSEMYDELTQLGAQFGVDMKALADKRAEDELETLNRIAQGEAETANARIMLAQGLSQALGATIDIIGNKSGELTGFQKILAVAQIAIDSAVALAKAPKLSAESASGFGPAAPLVFATNLATISGIILTSIARAKSVLSNSDVPEWNSTTNEKPNTGRSRPPKTQRKSFYFGGDTGELGIGLGDQYGDFTGYVHANEYVIPSMTVSEPYVANLLPAIEQIRQDNIRGFSSMSGKGMMGDPETKALLKQLVKITAAWPKEVRSKIVYTEFKEVEEEEEFLKSRYRA